MTVTRPEDRSLLCAVMRAGNGPPLYIVPSVGMTALSLINVARSIDPPRPIYSFEFAGMEDDRSPHTSIEDLADAYVAEIRRHQPTGPYYIGGHCFGGVVALEIVSKLETQGERVAVLVMIDAIGPEVAADGSEADGQSEQGRLSRAELEAHFENIVRLLYQNVKRHFALLPPATARQFKEVIETHLAAGLRYRIRPVRTGIALLRTPAHDARVFHGWRSIGTGGYREVEVPGDTFSMLKPPHVRVLGQRLSEILNALK